MVALWGAALAPASRLLLLLSLVHPNFLSKKKKKTDQEGIESHSISSWTNIADLWSKSSFSWDYSFRRPLKEKEFEDCMRLFHILSKYVPPPQDDKWIWPLDTTRSFSISSVFRHLTSAKYHTASTRGVKFLGRVGSQTKPPKFLDSESVRFQSGRFVSVLLVFSFSVLPFFHSLPS